MEQHVNPPGTQSCLWLTPHSDRRAVGPEYDVAGLETRGASRGTARIWEALLCKVIDNLQDVSIFHSEVA